jgi:hypothetical protein
MGKGDYQGASRLSLSHAPGFKYHVFLDNLFISTRFIKYARTQGIAITGTCRDTGGVIQELLDLKKSDKKDIIK